MSNTPSHPLQRAIVPPKLPHPINPALIKHAEERAGHLQDRIADAITRFAGSMQFVYIHIVWFAVWIIFRVENYPFGLLTMIVSLEAIFLSTFVMISQNRADEKRQVIADEQWRTVQEEERQNEVLLRLSNEMLALVREIHATSGTAGATRGHRHDRIGHICGVAFLLRRRRYSALDLVRGRRWARASGCGWCVHRDDDLATLGAALTDVGHRLEGLLEREGAVDDRPQGSGVVQGPEP